MYRIILLIILMMSVFLPFTVAAADGTVPSAALKAVTQLDQQLRMQLGGYPRHKVHIAMTVPANLGNLKSTNALARQMAEELANNLVAVGYALEEIRKGYDIQMEPGLGELLLTRATDHLATRTVDASIVVSGTYTVSPNAVRFNIRMLHLPNNRVLASSSVTVPVTAEIYPLVAERRPYVPSTRTRLQ